MPYLAPEAAMPIISCAPRFADRKASPATQPGMERPADAQYEDEVDAQDEVVDPTQLDALVHVHLQGESGGVADSWRDYPVFPASTPRNSPKPVSKPAYRPAYGTFRSWATGSRIALAQRS